MEHNKLALKKAFLEFFNAQEGFSLRSERFYAEFEAGILREKRLILWMEEAFIAGAKSEHKHWLNIL